MATLECKSCYDEVPVTDLTSPTTKCDHKNICRTCLNRNINYHLNEMGGDTEIECLESGCKELMEYEDIKRIASEDLLKRYDYFCFRQAIRQMPDFRWCKNSNCGSGQEHFERENAPIMICIACGKMTCYTHDVPWHEGRTCTQYDIEIETIESATRDTIERETKPCPKCQIRIYKSDGSHHMVCACCHHDFCWLCGADYNDIRKYGYSHHEKTCEMYRNKI